MMCKDETKPDELAIAHIAIRRALALMYRGYPFAAFDVLKEYSSGSDYEDELLYDEGTMYDSVLGGGSND